MFHLMAGSADGSTLMARFDNLPEKQRRGRAAWIKARRVVGSEASESPDACSSRPRAIRRAMRRVNHARGGGPPALRPGEERRAPVAMVKNWNVNDRQLKQAAFRLVSASIRRTRFGFNDRQFSGWFTAPRARSVGRSSKTPHGVFRRLSRNRCLPGGVSPGDGSIVPGAGRFKPRLFRIINIGGRRFLRRLKAAVSTPRFL